MIFLLHFGCLSIDPSTMKGVDLPNRRRDDYEDRGRGNGKKGGSPGLCHSGCI